MYSASYHWFCSLGALVCCVACASAPNSAGTGPSPSSGGGTRSSSAGAPASNAGAGGELSSAGNGSGTGGGGASATGGVAGATPAAAGDGGGEAGPPEISVEEPVAGLPTLGSATLDESKPGRTVPDNFAGLSLEWSTGLTYLSDGKGAAMPATIGLFKNFEEHGHRVDLRIGGNSTDKTWWTAGPGTQPAKQTISVDNSYLTTFSGIHAQTGARFILGVDLALNDPQNPASFVKAALAGMPQGSVAAFEIGNEPDLYPNNGWRASTYGFTDYQKDVQSYITALSPLVGSQPLLTMPAFAGTGWFNQTKAVLSAQESKLSFVTLHNYPLSICGKMPGDASYPKITDLLTDHSTSGVESTYAPLISATNGLGLGLRMAEFNSIACGGAPGVSDTFAQALWALDVLFRFAESGALGVDFHTSQDYPAFRYANGALNVLPLYYGMLMFSLGTAEKGQLVPVQVQTTGRVRAFATVGSDGAVRLVAINEDAAATGKLTVTLSKTHGVAHLSRLTAPMLSAKTGLSFEGRTFDGSTDGKPVGTRTRNTVTPSGTSYAFGLPAQSAAALVIPTE